MKYASRSERRVGVAEHYKDFLGERVCVIVCEVGAGIIGVPVSPGPRVVFQEDGRDVVVDTLLIRDVVWDDGSVEVVALVIGKNCGTEIERIVTMAKEKMTLPGCAMARVSREQDGWRIAGWRVVVGPPAPRGRGPRLRHPDRAPLRPLRGPGRGRGTCRHR